MGEDNVGYLALLGYVAKGDISVRHVYGGTEKSDYREDENGILVGTEYSYSARPENGYIFDGVDIEIKYSGGASDTPPSDGPDLTVKIPFGKTVVTFKYKKATYMVEHYLDNATTPFDKQTVTMSADQIEVTQQPAVSTNIPEGYEISHCDVRFPRTVKDGDVIQLYYKPTSAIFYRVEHYLVGESTFFDQQLVTLPVGQNQVTRQPAQSNKIPAGYEFTYCDKTFPLTVQAGDVIKLFYEKKSPSESSYNPPPSPSRPSPPGSRDRDPVRGNDIPDTTPSRVVDTTTIRDENPPLASLPEESSTTTITDQPTPLGDSPHTGTELPIKYALLLFALSGGFSCLLRGLKKK